MSAKTDPNAASDEQLAPSHVASTFPATDELSLPHMANSAPDTVDGLFFQIPENVHQPIEGNGNNMVFDLNQVNNLVSNGTVDSPSVSFSVGGIPTAGDLESGIPHAIFSQDATAYGGSAAGGSASANDLAATMRDGSGLTAGASDGSAHITQDAFTQSIVTGANVQFNSQEFTLTTHDSSDVSGFHH